MERIIKEYNNEAAIVGAPVGCRDQRYAPDILKRTPYAIFGTVATADQEEQPIRWNKNGLVHVSTPGPHDLVMEPLGFCDGRPVWSGDILIDRDGCEVEFLGSLAEIDLSAYVWPPVAPKWPLATIDPAALFDAWKKIPMGSRQTGELYLAVANAAIAHECEAGNLIPREVAEKMVRRAFGMGFDGRNWTLDGRQTDALIKTIVAGG